MSPETLVMNVLDFQYCGSMYVSKWNCMYMRAYVCICVHVCKCAYLRRHMREYACVTVCRGVPMCVHLSEP